MRLLMNGNSAADNERTIHTGNPHHDRQSCPQCGSRDLAVTAEHDTRGYNGYRCNSCGCRFGN